MIDIHNHLLFDVDDGAKTIEESVSVIKKLSENGVTDIILTPHYINYTSYTSTKEKNKKTLEKLKSKLKKKKINVNLYLGNEVYIDNEILKLLKEEKISTLNDSKYILVELPMSGKSEIYIDVCLDLMNKGYYVILAHPERYIEFQKNFDLLYELKDIGVLFQCNIESILGVYGKKSKKTIKKLFKCEMVDFIATDIHHEKSDYEFIEKAKKRIIKILSEEEYNDLIENNARKIVK